MTDPTADMIIADLIRRHAEAERVEPRVVLRDIALTAAERAA